MHYEPDLEALRVLALVAKESSMSAASAQLGVSQQAISLRIRNLEKDLRMRLLVRSARGSRLTPAGELVVGWGTTLLTAADEFSDAVNSLRTNRGKMMRIAASLTIAEHLLPDWIARWRISHGNDGPVVQLTAANSSTVVEAIREGTADLGLVETPVVPAGLRSVTVAYDTIDGRRPAGCPSVNWRALGWCSARPAAAPDKRSRTPSPRRAFPSQPSPQPC